MSQSIRFIFLFGILFCLQETASLQDLSSDIILSKINENLAQGHFIENTVYLDSIVSLPYFKKINCHNKGTIYHKIGVSYYLLDEFVTAKSFFQDSVLVVWSQCDDVTAGEKGKTQFNIGIASQYLNQYNDGRRYLDKALINIEADTQISASRYVRYYTDIANFYAAFNDYVIAELYLQKAIDKTTFITDEIDQKIKLANINYQWGKIHRAKSQFIDAANRIKKAISIREPLLEGAKDVETFKYYHDLAAVYFDQQNYREAQETAVLSLQFIDPLVDSVRLVETYEIFAEVNKALGHPDKSMVYNDEILNFSLGKLNYSEDYMRLARTYSNIAEIDTLKHDYAQALQHVDEAIAVLSFKSTPFRVEILQTPIDQLVTVDAHQFIKTLSLKAKIFSKRYHQESNDVSDLKFALSYYKKIDTLFTQKILDFRTEDAQLEYLEKINDNYGNAIEVCLTLYDATQEAIYQEEAYMFSSKTKALILLNTLEIDQIIAENTSPEEKEKRLHYKRQVNELNLELYDKTLNYDSISSLYFKAQQELNETNEKLISDNGELKISMSNISDPSSLDELQSFLHQDQVIVEYFWTDDKLYQFWISDEAFIVHSSDIDEGHLNNISQFIELCSDPASKPSDIYFIGSMLYQFLLADGIHQMSKPELNLIIIPDDRLYNISFEALSHDGSSYLVERLPISYTYSNRLLFRDQIRSGQPYVGYGSQYSKSFNARLHELKIVDQTSLLPALTLTDQELVQAATLWNGTYYLDEESTKSRFLEEPSSLILHLSLHGIVDEDLPVNSSILFDDREEDFALRASEMYTSLQPHDLVILSSCHSASGKIYRGEGVQGMSKAFLISGANTVMSSLWSASEQASLKIISQFLQELKDGSTRQLSLWKSKQTYLASAAPVARHPYYWANYILIGDASLIVRSGIFSYSFITIGVLGLLLILLIVKYLKSTT